MVSPACLVNSTSFEAELLLEGTCTGTGEGTGEVVSTVVGGS